MKVEGWRSDSNSAQSIPTRFTPPTLRFEPTALLPSDCRCVLPFVSARLAKSPGLSQRTREGQGTGFLCVRKNGPAGKRKVHRLRSG
jgi:hypothetical protein